MAIHHRGQIAPLIAHFQVSGVTDPDLIRALYLDRVCPRAVGAYLGNMTSRP